MKILYFGSDVFLTTFERLLKEGHQIVALYTYHDETEYIREENIAALAVENNIPVHYDRISLEHMTELFESGAVDVLLSLEYDTKIPVPDIEAFRGVNVHNSLLPEGRGYFPIEMRLFKGYDYGGVTMHKLATDIDRGDIVLTRKFKIKPEDNDRSLYALCKKLGEEMVFEFLSDMEKLYKKAKPQVGEGSYWYLPKEEDYTILRSMTEKEMHHIYRSFGRFTRLDLAGRIYKVENIKTYGYKDEDLIKPTADHFVIFEAADCRVMAELQEGQEIEDFPTEEEILKFLEEKAAKEEAEREALLAKEKEEQEKKEQEEQEKQTEQKIEE